MTPSTAIILLNWNGASDTIACLESLLNLKNGRFGILVCDNDSQDDSVARIVSWARDRLPLLAQDRARRGRPPLTFHAFTATADRGPGPDWPLPDGGVNRIGLIRTGGNLGFAGGCNVGLRYALSDGFDYCWLLNNDTEVDDDALDHLIGRMEQDPDIGICGSTLVYASRPDRVQNLGGNSFNPLKGRGVALGFGTRLSEPVDPAWVERQLAYVSGASMLVSRRFLEIVGLMAEDYFLYYEEPDWAERARGRFKLGYAPASIVRHKVGASIGTDDFGGSSHLSAYYMTRNRLRFCWRFHKAALPFTMADISRDLLKAGLRGDPSRISTLLRAVAGLSYKR